MIGSAPRPPVLQYFERICAEVQGRGRGMTLGQVGDAFRLAEEVTKPAEARDPKTILRLERRLGLPEDRL